MQQDGFVIHQLVRTNYGYRAKGNFFVSVNSEQNWAFEEAGNTVTLITNSPNSRLADAGPIAGLLKTGQAFHDHLTTLGMNVIGSPIIMSKKGEVDLITGQLLEGLTYKGEVRYDSQGRATKIICMIEEPSNSYDLSWEISHSDHTRHATRVLQTRRDTGKDWRRYAEYSIVGVDPVPTPLHMKEFWKNFTNETTRLVVYDPAIKTRFFLNRPNCN